MPKKPEKKRHLTQLREALDLNQAEFARRLGVSASMIKKVEEGTRPGSEDLKARIYAETGLMFFNRDEVANLPDKPFAYSKAQHASLVAGSAVQPTIGGGGGARHFKTGGVDADGGGAPRR